MGDKARAGELELRDEIALHERGWRIKRFAWGVFALTLSAALLGLLGAGPASNAVSGNQGSSFWIEYQRFARYQAPSELKIHFKAPGQEELHLWFDRDFYENLQVQRFDPAPLKTLSAEDHVILVFLLQNEASSGKVVLDFKPGKFWRNQGQIRLQNGPSLHIKQFYYP